MVTLGALALKPMTVLESQSTSDIMICVIFLGLDLLCVKAKVLYVSKRKRREKEMDGWTMQKCGEGVWAAVVVVLCRRGLSQLG